MEAAGQGIPLRSYAEAHPELRTAIELWGIKE
jgi:ribulose 1,5-bisphosphate carboxylase large subunit-like protein